VTATAGGYDRGMGGTSERKGTAKRAVGWLTGDRQVEAEGRLEEAGGEAPESEAVVEDATVDVKREHGDYGRTDEPVESTDR
jgi:uncharacterized protein YjbJ (UPF0337 family)